MQQILDTIVYADNILIVTILAMFWIGMIIGWKAAKGTEKGNDAKKTKKEKTK